MLGSGAHPVLRSQQTGVPGSPAEQPSSEAAPASTVHASATDSLRAWAGLKIESVQFAGVDGIRLSPLPAQLPLQVGKPLRAEDVRESLRRLYATGLYQGIEVQGIRHGDQVSLIFSGKQTLFLGKITVGGVKNDRLTTQLQRATRLSPGTQYNEGKLEQADDLLQQTLQENGYYQGKVSRTTTLDGADEQVDVQYRVDTGKQVRVGSVKVQGDSGLTNEQFRRKGKLKVNGKVNRDTVSRAISGLRKNYQKQQRLEANVGLESKDFQDATNRLNYSFNAVQGPTVKIVVNGVKLSDGKIRNLVPVYQEGTVDEDLLNEGDRRIRDYYQRDGYFDVKVSHQRTASPTNTLIEYAVQLGDRHRVLSIHIKGNKYFSTDVIQPRLSVTKSNLFLRYGAYSQALTQADINAITNLYQSNGFSNVKVTSEVKAVASNRKNEADALTVTYQVDEGQQQKIGTYNVAGENQIPMDQLSPLLNLEGGQPYSASSIIGDRDAILEYYLKKGFSHAEVNIDQQTDKADPSHINVTFRIKEGEQIFVNRILVSGLHYTRPGTIAPHVLIHPGQPLDQSALLETQRQMYDLTLFNEVNAAVQNPAGNEQRKNVLLQFTEAKRWDVDYGFGFQAQTGNPSTNCPNPASLIQLGINPGSYEANCSPNGKTGASPLVLFDVSRLNLMGRNQSITLRTEYGTLEQLVSLIYSSPHIFNNPKFDFSMSGGYTNAQDVTTYAASRLEGTVRLTHRPTLPTTLIYQFTYRRVKVDPNSVQVAPNEIPLVSEPVRVGGPGVTWIRDTRRPTALDAKSGTYNSVEEFVTDKVFASEANFNRMDMTNSSYYTVNKKGLVLARSTRFGFERAFGDPADEYIPLPERLYAGGAQSLRGFSINSAGPRDSLTGFPIGGAGVFANSTELRFPNPRLPYLGDALGFVLFHDMGNVFDKSSDIWPSIIRIKQPHSYTCKDLSAADQQVAVRSSSTNETGTCNFNDFSHAIGLGLRYHTPIGPIRLDFSYNLNPPIYPVIVTYGTLSNGQAIPPYVGQAGHFNFFFSIGQAY